MACSGDAFIFLVSDFSVFGHHFEPDPGCVADQGCLSLHPGSNNIKKEEEK
jgi:hypothetical protein